MRETIFGWYPTHLIKKIDRFSNEWSVGMERQLEQFSHRERLEARVSRVVGGVCEGMVSEECEYPSTQTRRQVQLPADNCHLTI